MTQVSCYTRFIFKLFLNVLTVTANLINLNIVYKMTLEIQKYLETSSIHGIVYVSRHYHIIER